VVENLVTDKAAYNQIMLNQLGVISTMDVRAFATIEDTSIEMGRNKYQSHRWIAHNAI
jgi:hypothetical protein